MTFCLSDFKQGLCRVLYIQRYFKIIAELQCKVVSFPTKKFLDPKSVHNLSAWSEHQIPLNFIVCSMLQLANSGFPLLHHTDKPREEIVTPESSPWDQYKDENQETITYFFYLTSFRTLTNTSIMSKYLFFFFLNCALIFIIYSKTAQVTDIFRNL